MALHAGGDIADQNKPNNNSEIRQLSGGQIQAPERQDLTVAIISLWEEYGDREDRLLRRANGIIDEVVLPRLRARGVAESDLHATAMHDVRLVQSGYDRDGELAKLLGVVRCGVNGTRSADEK